MPAQTVPSVASAFPDSQGKLQVMQAILADLTAIKAFLMGLKAKKTNDFASIAGGAAGTTTVTVTGALLGDLVEVSLSIDAAGLAPVGYVSAADTVTVVLINNTGGAVDLASCEIQVVVHPKITLNSLVLQTLA